MNGIHGYINLQGKRKKPILISLKTSFSRFPVVEISGIKPLTLECHSSALLPELHPYMNFTPPVERQIVWRDFGAKLSYLSIDCCVLGSISPLVSLRRFYAVLP